MAVTYIPNSNDKKPEQNSLVIDKRFINEVNESNSDQYVGKKYLVEHEYFDTFRQSTIHIKTVYRVDGYELCTIGGTKEHEEVMELTPKGFEYGMSVYEREKNPPYDFEYAYQHTRIFKTLKQALTECKKHSNCWIRLIVVDCVYDKNREIAYDVTPSLKGYKITPL